ncbi:hypothetical protein DYB34_007790, partial [Aphanomyces astaci]
DNEERERGTFKKRPRDPTDDPSTVLCRGVAAGEGCSFEDKCKFSHDVADFLKRRPKDLGDTCPVFAANGYCRYGLNCCYGLSHVDANHVNLGTPADFKATEANDLSMDNRNLLRKSTYPFRSVASTYKKKGGMAKKARDFKIDTVDNPNIPDHKPVEFKGKVYIGPLTTVGNLPFRRVLKQWGADITCGEMAMTTNLLQGQWALLRRHESEDVFGVQIAGAFGDQTARVCELITREAGAGAALMNRTPKLCEVISGALTGIEVGSFGRATRPGLTVKMRTGWSDKQPLAHKLVPKVQSLRSGADFMNQSVVLNYAMRTNVNVDALTIHGRSRLQRYSKSADWVYVEECANAREAGDGGRQMALIGGGDVLSYEEFHQHLSSGVLDTCMLARGALIKVHRCVDYGRNDLETLMASDQAVDWIKISEMLLGPVPEGFQFVPKHKANAYA